MKTLPSIATVPERQRELRVTALEIVLFIDQARLRFTELQLLKRRLFAFEPVGGLSSSADPRSTTLTAYVGEPVAPQIDPEDMAEICVLRLSKGDRVVILLLVVIGSPILFFHSGEDSTIRAGKRLDSMLPVHENQCITVLVSPDLPWALGMV